MATRECTTRQTAEICRQGRYGAIMGVDMTDFKLSFRGPRESGGAASEGIRLIATQMGRSPGRRRS